ncbi:hypothetical protein N7510_001295 [Penicillium lagena]|uniref:uncharacterized protein n=1 Tax=Penicillium lagena TaxID=94218 RepID=UPI0025414BF7|nr:uncharacterized protein N7510_001295 [Penicillium lagena]KAJ5624986.1 hypothetical protein N7510_001295 [Penicillium lagena]
MRLFPLRYLVNLDLPNPDTLFMFISFSVVHFDTSPGPGSPGPGNADIGMIPVSTRGNIEKPHNHPHNLEPDWTRLRIDLPAHMAPQPRHGMRLAVDKRHKLVKSS